MKLYKFDNNNWCNLEHVVCLLLFKEANVRKLKVTLLDGTIFVIEGLEMTDFMKKMGVKQ